MKGFALKFTIILIIYIPITAENKTTDINEDRRPMYQINGSTVTPHHILVKRCWDSVIPGRPTLAKVVLGGSFFIVTALVAGLVCFFRTYCKHHDEFLEITDDLLAGRRIFKPQLEDMEMGFSAKTISHPASYMKQLLRDKMGRRRKEEEEVVVEEEREDQEDVDENLIAPSPGGLPYDKLATPSPGGPPYDKIATPSPGGPPYDKLATQSPGGLPKVPPRAKRERTRPEEEPEGESQAHRADPKKRNATEKGERREKSDPAKKNKKLEDKKPLGKPPKNLGKKTVGKAAEKSVKKVKPPPAEKKKKETKAPKPPKKPKKQKAPKPPKKK